jgi:magnesium-transporting ATPase (P-type)/class 3 adenylate cyclase
MASFHNREESSENHEQIRELDLFGGFSNGSDKFPTNKIWSSRFTGKKVIPKSIFEQFQKLSNLWFLFISILSFMYFENSFWNRLSRVIPLIFILGLNVFKDFLSFWQQRTTDMKTNLEIYLVWNGQDFEEKLSMDVKVGDILLIFDTKTIPADLLLLSIDGYKECFADTFAVLGERNLQVKKPVKDTQALLNGEDLSEVFNNLKRLNGQIAVFNKSKAQDFTGKIKLRGFPKATRLSYENLLLKGTIVKNAHWAIGYVLFTGPETCFCPDRKKRKISTIDKKLEIWNGLTIVALMIFTFIGFIIGQVYFKDPSAGENFAGLMKEAQNLIPISFYLVVYLIRNLKSFQLTRSGLALTVNNPEILEDLGNVDYIVVNKTGTLTENQLKAQVCVVLDKVFLNLPVFTPSEIIEFRDTARELQYLDSESYTFDDLKNSVKIRGSPAYHFLMCMACCNYTSTKGMGEEYFSLSEDDKVLVETSLLFGMKLLTRSSGAFVLNFNGEELEYVLMASQPFSTSAKKCRVLLKDPGQSHAYLYVKGSKEDMLDILSMTSEEKTGVEEFTLSRNLIKMRVVMMGYKKLTSQELENFDFTYQTALSCPVNSSGRIDDLFETFEKGCEFLGIVAIEDIVKENNSLCLKLLRQAGVKTWITSGDNEESTLIAGVGSRLFEENVRMVRLSHFSNENECRTIMMQQIKEHIKHDHGKMVEASNSFLHGSEEDDDGSNTYRMRSEPLIMNATPNVHPLQDRKRVHNLVGASNATKDQMNSIQSESIYKIRFNPNSVYFVLSVDKTGLDFGLASEENRKLFISLLFAAQCVCFHSLQSEDKTRVVRMLKNNFRFKPVVLTISDSQCDAGMIQEAHIGISLETGRSQLMNISDVSISTLSYLQDLLIFHGHWSHINLSGILSFSLYSNTLLFTVLYLFNIFSEFSGSVIISDELLVIYTILLPVIQMVFVGIYDQDLNDSQLLSFPQVYSLGVHKEIITYRRMSLALAEGLAHGVVVAIFFHLSSFNTISSEGKSLSYEDTGLALVLTIFVINSCKLIHETHSWSLKTFAGHLISTVSIIIHVLVLSNGLTQWTGFVDNLKDLPAMMANCFLLPGVIFTLQAGVVYSKSIFWPDVLQYIKKIHLMDITFDLVSRLEFFKDELLRVYLKSKDWNSKVDIESLDFSKKTLRFLSDEKEKDYTWNKVQENLKSFRYLLVSSVICLSLLTLSISLIYEVSSKYNFIILPVLLLGFCALVKYSYSRNFYKTFIIFLPIYYFSILVFLVIAGEIFNFHYIEGNSVLIIIFLIAFNSDWFSISTLSFMSLSSTIFDSISYYKKTGHSEQVLIFLLFYTSLLLNSAAVGYGIDKTKRQEFILIQKVETEVDKSKNILSYLLPAFVRKRVKDGAKYISDDQGTVSVFFCDIMDFEEIVAGFTPLELTTFLDDVFGKFDTLCRAVGVTKIETVGKTYMACAGLKDSEEELDPYFSTVGHARRAIELGIGVLRIANSIKVRKGVTLSVKIGINSGTVTAGVIGYHKPQFSLVGDTVNTASRMASTCTAANTIQISKSTYDILEDKKGLVFTPRSAEVKGKGQMETFMVRLPIGALETTIYEVNHQASARMNHSPQGMSARTVTYFPRSSFVETQTIHERRLSNLLTHLEVSDPLQLFLRKDTEVIERVKLISFSCSESTKEKKFRLETVENNKPVIIFAMIVIILCNVLVGIVFLVSFSMSRLQNSLYLIKLLIETIFEVCLLTGIKWYSQQLWFAWSLQLVYVFSVIVELMISFFEPVDLSIQFLSYLNHVLLFSHCAELFFKHNLWSLVLVTLLRLVRVLLFDPENNVISAFYTIICTCTLIFTTFSTEKMLRTNSTLKAAANKELDKTEKLIKKMMPPHVVQKMKEESSFTDKIQHVTVLYADIVGFTAWSSTRSPEEIVGMLSELFTSFDKNCVKHNVYKVHTIGDCYVAMGFTGEANRNHLQECLNIVEFAQQMIDIIRDVNIENGINLNMRIGIHTGDVTAGVTGTNIVRYDIYGSDVMIANKIESCGVPGKIAVSMATKNLIESSPDNTCRFLQHVDFNVKSAKKKIQTFLIDL